jgi:hypothetical protein
LATKYGEGRTVRKRGYTLLREGNAEGGSVYRIIGVAQSRAA